MARQLPAVAMGSIASLTFACGGSAGGTALLAIERSGGPAERVGAELSLLHGARSTVRQARRASGTS